ncbi:hypothetical protein RHMOL_Rhmol06G0282200 [Rhododendron molle]|uniref:Uncharacterized protein n=1 Tax=Rhododendron molle TaxID=49168 RepID=A0ACC0NIS7_RHOML|nr:hypothetical protein RHMOL_Rhmol06G0282200 [Rhododendron molle]
MLAFIKHQKPTEKMKANGFQFYYLCFLLFLCFSSALSLGNFIGEEGEDIYRSQFPDGFLFGTSTSSYQIEGAYLEDGKRLNNWDFFNHRKGNIDGDNGDVADDHYHRYLEDIEILHSLGANSYRFSLSWARILPTGGRFGGVNPTGVSFYNKILDNLLLKVLNLILLASYVVCVVIRKDFVYFAETCFTSFGDRVKYWITINEPNLFALKAYMTGSYPPAHCSEPFGNCPVGNSDVEPLIVMHNMILAHAKAVKLYRDNFQKNQGGFMGIVVTATMALDPLVFGDYPSEMRHYHGKELPSFSAEEKEYVKGSIDFIGLNHYSTSYAKDCLYSSCPSGGDRAIQGFAYTTGERNGVLIGDLTGMANFFVVPRGMEEIVNYVKDRYHNKPMYVLENGYSPPRKQEVQVQEVMNDVKRIEFHKAYLASLARSIRDGADVRGYFVWTLMDSYEWVEGYNITFGLYYIDRKTLERTPKQSALCQTPACFLIENLRPKMKDKSLQFYYFCFLLFLCFSPAHSLVRNCSTGEEGEDINRSQFPDGFFFGTATSSYQIEGAFLEDGKRLNNWDVFNHREGNINGENGDVADDHYHREDFVYFAETCFKSFGDRVKHWITINEPNLFADMAYIRGRYPPAHCSEPFGSCPIGNSDVEPLLAMHNMLLAHGKAAKLYRDHFQKNQGGVIGIVVSAFMYKPLTENEVDLAAANRALAFNVAW